MRWKPGSGPRVQNPKIFQKSVPIFVPIALELEALLNFLSAVAAISVSYYAFRANRLVDSSLLRYICLGFMLLGVGLASEGLVQLVTGMTAVDAARFSSLRLLDFLFFTALQLVAYFIFAWGYALSAFGKPRQLAVAAPIAFVTTSKELRAFVFSLGVFLLSQLGIIILMLFVVVQGLFVYSRSPNKFALTVLVGFVMIFVAHIVLFSSVIFLSAPLYLVGEVVQFAGFCAFLYFLYTSGHVVSS